MTESYKNFVETFKVKGTRRVVEAVSVLGNFDYTNCTTQDIKRIIISMEPTCIRSIYMICYVMKMYAEYLGVDITDALKGVDKAELWDEIKINAPKKFLSHEDFEQIYHDIGVYEEFNAFYYQMFFRCFYEGVCSDDMSILKNLRASDINGNILTLRKDNGEVFEMEVSEELSEGLKELGDFRIWERQGKYNVVNIFIDGLHYDSCFKIELRGGNKESDRFKPSFYKYLNRLTTDYFGHSVSPLEMVVSGIMHRVITTLNDRGIDYREALTKNAKNKEVADVISQELKRCRLNMPIYNFYTLVKGHLDCFESPMINKG